MLWSIGLFATFLQSADVIQQSPVASQPLARSPKTSASMPVCVGPLWCTKATSWSSLGAPPV
jgi:hypothetical protein